MYKTKLIILFFLTFFLFWLLLPYGLFRLGFFLDNSLRLDPTLPLPIKLSAVILLLLGLYIALKASLTVMVIGESIPSFLAPPKRLIEVGLYAHSRHPLFVGYALILLAMAVIYNSLSTLLIVLPLFFGSLYIYILLIEEPLTIRRYGDRKYRKYRQQVPRIWSFHKKGLQGPSLPRLILQASFNLLGPFLFPIEVFGKENIPEEGGVFFVGNHLSYLDPFFMGGHCFRTIRYLTTAQVFRKPVFRWFLKKMGAIPVKRFQKDPGGLRRMFRLMSQGYCVGYFPEGKRTWTGAPSPYPEGVGRVLRMIKYPIIPVSVCGLYSVMPRWSDKWRRARTRVIFHPEFKIDPSWDEATLLAHLSAILHPPNQNFDHHIYTRKDRNQGIARLFWRCPVCGELDSINAIKNIEVSCAVCRAHWQLTDDNQMLIHHPKNFPAPKKHFWQWYGHLLKFPFPHISKSTGYLNHRSGRCVLSGGVYPDLIRKDTGYLTLSTDQVHFFGDKDHFQWAYQAIQAITIEGNKQIQVTFKDTQIQFYFLEDSALKWQVLLEFYRHQ